MEEAAMSALPEAQNDLAALIDKAHQQEEAGREPRLHLGASMLGHPCDRWLWLSFRWAAPRSFEGRVLRIFRRGQREEETILKDLQMAGIEIVSEQARVAIEGHVAGTIDAIVLGVPEAPTKQHVAEFKTHNKASFTTLTKQGVEAFKPEHYVQMQVYMHATGLERALYVAICKDDDRYYFERVKYDRLVAEDAIARGLRVSCSDHMPEPMYQASAAWWQCKSCPGFHFCHVSNLTTEVNCRTCAHYTARTDGTSHCAVWDSEIPVEAQIEGCPKHVIHPDLTPWKMLDSPDGVTGAYMIDGQKVMNGDGHVSSKELIDKHWVPF
jgi:hypothetical protein